MRNPSATIPKGIGGPPVAGMDPRKGKLMCIKVRMLDDTVAVFHLGHKADGQSLFDEVCRHLNLIESDYFGLEFVDCYGNRCWLDKDKSILRQITTTHSDARFYFIVKFYPPSSTDIEEEYTRYLVSLQIRRDLGRGELLCNENTAALLISYYVQSDCGDFSEIDYPDHSYLSAMSFIPKQTPSFQIKVMENHKSICGMSPSDCDLSILETSRKCEFYGEGALNHNEESDTFVPQIIMRKPQNQNNVNPLQESKSAGKIESSQYCVTQTSKSYNVSQTNETRTKSMYNPKTTDNSDRHCVSDFEGSEIGMPNVIYSKVYSAKNKQTNNNNIDSLNALYATVIPHDTDDVDDNISLSMPNVAKGEKLQLRTHFFASEIPTKSASGENFNEYQVRTNKNNIPKDFDYDSEGSYRLGEDVSSASDLLSNIGSADPRALNTVFTAKRVGDVLVKTVVTANVKKEDIESDESKNKTYGVGVKNMSSSYVRMHSKNVFSVL
uniref:Moesin/ezrin/radixin homolog 1 n=1 Tax=Rhabditophanes sp. KR3021 TaxID=114890 RepID=A0AC35UG53_9BILA